MLRYRNYYFIFLACFLYFFSHFLINETLLPDYEAYKTIYNIQASNFADSGNDLFFVYFVKFFYELNFSYEAFRISLVSISLFLIVFSTVVFVKYSNLVLISRKTNYYDLSFGLMLVFAVYFLLFEFYSVRLRAGLSISFFYTSLVFFIVSNKSSWLRLLAIVFFLLSIGAHLMTAVTLFGFLMVPTILFLNMKFFTDFLTIRKFLLLCFILSVLSGFFIVLGVVFFSNLRGDNLNSNLNPVRFLFISIFPILIYFFWEIKKIKRDILSYEMLFGGDRRKSSITLSFAKEIWVYFITMAYVGCALVLSLFYVVGMISTAGEAVVRVFTLSSVASILVLTLKKNKISFFWVYIIFINSMFFFNTVFL